MFGKPEFPPEEQVRLAATIETISRAYRTDTHPRSHDVVRRPKTPGSLLPHETQHKPPRFL